RNVLAIHGLNISAEDADFLLLPELEAATVTVQTNTQNYFAIATPGEPNSGGAPGVAPAPVFLTPGGIFSNNISVELFTESLFAEIRYTLNGSEPTESSALYSGPIALSGSATVRARGFGERLLPSEILSQTY